MYLQYHAVELSGELHVYAFQTKPFQLPHLQGLLSFVQAAALGLAESHMPYMEPE